MDRLETVRADLPFHLDGTQLKLIALITMVIDHIGAFFCPHFLLLRYIGRISFPIYCYLLTEGAKYTHDMKKYLLRLGLFALISEIPFNLVRSGSLLDPSGQNVFFTLFIGMGMIYLIEHPVFNDGLPDMVYILIIIACAAGLAEFANTDYGFTGIAIIFVFYVFRDKGGYGMIMAAICFSLLNIGYGYYQWMAIFALIPIALYDGRRGRQSRLMQYGFYAFYPAHMLIGYLIGMVLGL